MDTLKWHRVLFALVCLILTPFLMINDAAARSPEQEAAGFANVDAYVTEQMNNLGIPGMALGIVQGGEIVHLQGFGVADASGRKVTPQTPFHIGSLSKSFTALAIMQLVEAGKIDLDAPVQTYLPWFELADQEVAAQITVRHLLNQTSGISTKDGNRFWPSQRGLEETVRGLGTIQPTQPVGTTFQYSNINYMIAGVIIEEVSGQSYADYITENIFEPLDMRHAYTSRTPALADGLADGHIYMFGQTFRDEGPLPPSFLSTGFLIASAEDMSHYMIAQLNDGCYEGLSVLSPPGITELHAPAAFIGGEFYYAMGWAVGTQDGSRIISHNGDTGRFHANVALLPDHNSGVVLLANATGFEQVTQVDEITLGVVNLLTGKTAADISLAFGQRFQYWALLLAPFLQIFVIVSTWRRRQSIHGWSVFLTVILNLAVVFFLFRLSLQIITLPSMLVFYPEIGYSLVATAALGTGWTIFYIVASLKTRIT